MLFLASDREIFQSTLLQEERRHLKIPPFPSVSFNPRSYKRSDVSETKTEKYLLLSIHAPTRGATICKIPPEIGLNTFNPRSYKRSDRGEKTW